MCVLFILRARRFRQTINRVLSFWVTQTRKLTEKLSLRLTSYPPLPFPILSFLIHYIFHLSLFFLWRWYILNVQPVLCSKSFIIVLFLEMKFDITKVVTFDCIVQWLCLHIFIFINFYFNIYHIWNHDKLGIFTYNKQAKGYFNLFKLKSHIVFLEIKCMLIITFLYSYSSLVLHSLFKEIQCT